MLCDPLLILWAQAGLGFLRVGLIHEQVHVVQWLLSDRATHVKSEEFVR